MSKSDIFTREDINFLVGSFYKKVRAHETLGPIFNGVIKDWDDHLVKLADFWQTNLLFEPRYKGNPMQAHIDVDRHFDGTIQQAHFGQWIQLWFETLDELFEGPKQHLAKERARNMSHMMFIRIFQAREQGVE